MKLTNKSAEIYVPDGADEKKALKRTTSMGVVAHQDDLEILAYHAIVKAFGSNDEWFTGVVMTNGGGSPRTDLYANYTDEEMREVRRREQKKAAFVGEYAAVALLDYPSSEVKSGSQLGTVSDLKELLTAARPEVIYTHNPADKHDTHVAVTLRLLQALRELPTDLHPKALYGCEVWRDLDWLHDNNKVTLQVDSHENLAVALLGIYDSQIAGGKRYDLATLGRRRAHATFHESHDTDTSSGLTFAMDLTPLLQDTGLSLEEYVDSHVQRFAEEVRQRIRKLNQ